MFLRSGNATFSRLQALPTPSHEHKHLIKSAEHVGGHDTCIGACILDFLHVCMYACATSTVNTTHRERILHKEEPGTTRDRCPNHAKEFFQETGVRRSVFFPTGFVTVSLGTARWHETFSIANGVKLDGGRRWSDDGDEQEHKTTTSLIFNTCTLGVSRAAHSSSLRLTRRRLL